MKILFTMIAFLVSATAVQAQMLAFLGPDPTDLGSTVTYLPDSHTATVVAVGGSVSDDYNPAETTSDFFVAVDSENRPVRYFVKKVALHKIASDSQGPEKGFIWIQATGQLGQADPGRGRWKWGSLLLPDGPAGDGYFTMMLRDGSLHTCLSIIVLGEGNEPVTLLCPDCGHIWSVIPVVGEGADLLNDTCPACGDAAVTADTFSTE